MVMKFEDISDECKVLFGDLSEDQMWFLVKMIKHTRGRCRSNIALNNYLNREFRDFTFTTVLKKDSHGDDYKALKIDRRV